MILNRFEYVLDKSDLVDGRSVDVVRALVNDEKGCRAIAFLSAKLVRGRVRFTLTTKKHRGQETVTGAVADWVI